MLSLMRMSAVANAGFVAVDFYGGAIIYDFENQHVHLWRSRLVSARSLTGSIATGSNGSTRFMAPEEFRRGATIDERTTVFTLGRAACVFLRATVSAAKTTCSSGGEVGPCMTWQRRYGARSRQTVRVRHRVAQAWLPHERH